MIHVKHNFKENIGLFKENIFELQCSDVSLLLDRLGQQSIAMRYIIQYLTKRIRIDEDGLMSCHLSSALFNYITWWQRPLYWLGDWEAQRLGAQPTVLGFECR